MTTTLESIPTKNPESTCSGIGNIEKAIAITTIRIRLRWKTATQLGIHLLKQDES